jgi:hypothetical protein
MSAENHLRRSESSRMRLVDKRQQRYAQMLREGHMFKKYKNGGSKKTRRIWCTNNLDRVIWGKDGNDVRGFLLAADILEVNKGHGDAKQRIFIVGLNRVLELEAATSTEQHEWVAAFRYLIAHQSELEEQMALNRADPSFCARQLTLAAQYSQLLKHGHTFKKFKKSSCTVRTIRFTDNLDRILWEDVEKKKIKGHILRQDMVSVSADVDGSNHRFSINAVDRNLILEAPTMQIKKQWIDAIQFYVQHGDNLAMLRGSM